MAELLVLNTSSTHPDPIKDQKECWKKGMIAAVMDDGHQWGKKEGPPIFTVVKVPGVPKEKFSKYLEHPEEEVTIENEKMFKPTRRRIWKMDLETLPLDSKTIIESKGALIAKATDDLVRRDIDWTSLKDKLVNLETSKVEVEDVTRSVK